MASGLILDTPSMRLDKQATWQPAERIGGDPLVELIRLDTHSCWLGDRESLHPLGCGWGECPACELRSNGWTGYKAGNAAS